jgi:hypothetical protein
LVPKYKNTVSEWKYIIFENAKTPDQNNTPATDNLRIPLLHSDINIDSKAINSRSFYFNEFSFQPGAFVLWL